MNSLSMMNNAPLKAEGQPLSNTVTGLTNEIQVQQVAEIGDALPAALDRYLPVVIDVAIDPVRCIVSTGFHSNIEVAEPDIRTSNPNPF